MSNNYGPRIVTDGLVLCLDAADRNSYPGTGSTWGDLSGNGNNGTFGASTAAPTFSSSNGGCIVFDGNNDKVTSDSNVGISGDFNATLSIWVKLFDLNTGYRCVCMFGSTSVAMGGFSIFTNIATYGSGSVTIGFYGSQNAYTPASTISINNWYNLVATKTSGSMSSSTTKLYINGVSQNLSFGSSLTPNAINAIAYVGNDPANEVSNNMEVSNFLIYNRALSANEVQQNYNATKGRFGL